MMLRSLCLVMLLATSGIAAPPDSPPNIVFILADDLGINDLGCFGRKDQHTPNLDRLAKEGLLFTQAYAACPVCSPTRASILTGKSPARLHLTTFLPGRADAPSQKLLHPKIQQALPLAELTIAERLKAHGYTSACIGKWHLGGAGFGPKEQGFDYVYAGKPNTTPSDTEGGKGEHDLTAKAIQFIETNRAKPFFVYLAHNTPHIPYTAKKSLIDKNRNSFNPTYAAVIEDMDASVGQLLAKLDDWKLRQNTIVIFTSDNGGLHVPELKEDSPTHNTPYRAGKGFLYEGGIRVPLIVRWPEVIKPGTNATPVITTDWTPTLLDCAGSHIDSPLDGVSVKSLFTGGTIPARELFWHVPHYTNQGSRPSGAIRDGQWKFIQHDEDNRVELFNLATDRSETTNLADKEPARTAKMKEHLAKWRHEVAAQMMSPNPNFNAALHNTLYIDTDVSQLKPAATAHATSEPLRAWRKAIDAATKK